MKYLITLISLFVAFGAWADNRLELGNANGGHHCHLQWSPNNADDEHKISCKVYSTQDGNSGNYNAYASGSFEAPRELFKRVGLPQQQPLFSMQRITTCEVTQGVFQDDNGNAFKTNDCTMRLNYSTTPVSGGLILVEYSLVLRDAAAAKAAKAMMAVGADEAGESVMFRQGMGYAQ